MPSAGGSGHPTGQCEPGHPVSTVQDPMTTVVANVPSRTTNSDPRGKNVPTETSNPDTPAVS